MPWDDDLRGAARDIAAAIESPLRVQAGPGAGKTFSLMRRITRLLEEGIPPERILVVTFTRVSALDLQRELALLSHPEADRVRKGTLHSLCFSMLHRANVLEYTGRIARPLLGFEQRFLLEDLKLVPILGNYYDRKRRLGEFEAAWATLQDQDPGWPRDDIDIAFQSHLNDWLTFHESMLVGEIVVLTLDYLRSNPSCPELSMFDYVLVDEYQDLNRAEQDLIDLLSTIADITIVGDEDQAIYESLKYAHPEGISAFHETHADTIDLPLETSRRCPTRIVEMANSLIAHNQRRTDRVLHPMPEAEPGDIHIVQWMTLEDEAEGLARYIVDKVQSGDFILGNTLVLCPRRQIGYRIRDLVRDLGQQAYSYFHEEILDGSPKREETSRAQQSMTLLNLMINSRDRVSLRCWLGFGHNSLRTNEYFRLRNYCEQAGLHPRDVLASIAVGDIVLPYSGNVVARYRELETRLTDMEGLAYDELLEHLFPAAEEWTVPIWRIINENPDKNTPEEIYTTLLTNITQPELPSDVDYLRVMSLHKSKGLNADNVIVTTCVEGLLPYRYDSLTPEDERIKLEEQRRLFYVAITRARQTLVLSSVLLIPRENVHSMRVQVRGGNQDYAGTITTRFIGELGPAAPEPIRGDDWDY